MSEPRTYLLAVTASALICCITKTLAGGKGLTAGLIRVLCGIFLCVSIAAPLADFQIRKLSDFSVGILQDGASASAYGEQLSRDSMAEIIKQKTQAYILDKAASLDGEITVEISLSETVPCVPCAVEICGRISPYGRTVLSALIYTELGIDREAQTWSVQG